jgi:ribA/ribD-fused uncharacterized protein
MGLIKEFQGEYRWLSNFATVSVTYMDKVYPSVEHAWVASKSEDEIFRDKCTNPSLHPAEVKSMGDKIKPSQHWVNNKETIMKELLVSKFTKEPFRTKLIESGNDYIQEGNWWSDTYWGHCLKTDTGTNKLGLLIMEVRFELIKAS